MIIPFGRFTGCNSLQRLMLDQHKHRRKQLRFSHNMVSPGCVQLLTAKWKCAFEQLVMRKSCHCLQLAFWLNPVMMVPWPWQPSCVVGIGQRGFVPTNDQATPFQPPPESRQTLGGHQSDASSDSTGQLASSPHHCVSDLALFGACPFLPNMVCASCGRGLQRREFCLICVEPVKRFQV